MAERSNFIGPWRVRDDDPPNTDVVGPDGKVLLSVYPELARDGSNFVRTSIPAAEAKARLIAVSTILPDLYASEINVTIQWMWDAGFEVGLGDSWSGYSHRETFDGGPEGWVAALEWLRDRAIEKYPNSEFAKRYATAKAGAA